jgi:hypothetical protein
LETKKKKKKFPSSTSLSKRQHKSWHEALVHCYPALLEASAMAPKENRNNKKKHKRAFGVKGQATDNSPIVPQPDSPLLRLPGELQAQI